MEKLFSKLFDLVTPIEHLRQHPATQSNDTKSIRQSLIQQGLYMLNKFHWHDTLTIK